MGKRNNAKGKGQARKAARQEKRQEKKAAAASSSGGGGGGNNQSSGGGNNQSNSGGNNKGPTTRRELMQRIDNREAAGKGTGAAQAKLDALRAKRKTARDESYKSQGEISGVGDFDFSKRKKDHVEKGELRYLKREQGLSEEDIAAHVKESGMEIGRGAQKTLDRWSARADAKEKAAAAKKAAEDAAAVAEQAATTTTQVQTETSNANVESEPNTVPAYKPITVNPSEDLLNPGASTGSGSGNATQVEQSQDQTVSQDNDINSNVTGDNNNVNISQDNSVRQYGGINKSFVYNGSSNGNNYMDTPVSAGTMGGFFHDGDSPGKSASFVDRYQTMNNDYQKQFSNTNFAQQAITRAAQNKAVDIGAIDQRVNDRSTANRARSSSMAGDIFGDMFNYKPEDFVAEKTDDKDKEDDKD
jgi:hypothetical protein